MHIHIPKHLESRIIDLARDRKCTQVDVLDSILMLLEYDPSSIWRDCDREKLGMGASLAPEEFVREAAANSLDALVQLVSQYQELGAEDCRNLLGWKTSKLSRIAMTAKSRGLITISPDELDARRKIYRIR
jgi:hypothetical protein